mgnify:CR=1 FL=1
MDREIIESIVEHYDKSSLTIGTLGSHSALDICAGAKKQGFRTVVVCQRGREKVYEKYYRRRKTRWEDIGVVDDVIVLEKFNQILRKEVVEKLKNVNTIFIPHRSFCVYVGYDGIENTFEVPIFGNRHLLKVEERDVERNQYYLLKKAGIRIPKVFEDYTEIDRPVIVKVSESQRSYERAFFIVSTPEEFERVSDELVRKGVVRREDLESAVIEEFIVGAQFNFNFFYSPLSKELELLGIDMRRQTNLDGLLRLPHRWQDEALKKIELKFIEVGHIACTLRESLLERVFELGEKFVKITKEEYPPGIIGPFALQSAVIPGPPREDIVVFDVSVRSPGSPGISYTPYSYYRWLRNVSMGERIAMEIRRAVEEDRLAEVVT